jgi:hypothetical protein
VRLALQVHALCASVAGLEDQVQKTTLLKNIIGPVRQSLEATLSTAAGSGGSWLQHGGGDAFHAALSMLQGACKAGDFYTYDVSYELAAPALKSFPPLLEACGEYNDIVGAIVHLYLAIAEYQVSFMSEFQMRLFNEACLLLLQVECSTTCGTLHSFVASVMTPPMNRLSMYGLDAILGGRLSAHD